MKLSGNRIRAFLSDPDPQIAAVLLYGPDRGLISERCRYLLTRVVADPTDPFVVTELSWEDARKDPTRLADEVATLSLTGERRVVVVRGADQTLADRIAPILAEVSPDATFLLIEAGELAPRDKLRKLIEGAGNAAALPCYLDEGADLEALIQLALREKSLAIEPPALAYLLENLGSDRAVTRSELEKLDLFKGEDRSSITLEEAESCVGNGAPLLVDDLVLAAASGDQQGLNRSLDTCIQAGENPISILRAMVRHMQRLHLAAGFVAQGRSPADALKQLRPPVFFKQQPVLRGQLGHWRPHRLSQALELLLEAEIQCKSTGMPAEIICHRALMRIAQAARAG